MNNVRPSLLGWHDQAEARVSSAPRTYGRGGLRVFFAVAWISPRGRREHNSQPFPALGRNRFSSSLLKPSNRPTGKPREEGGTTFNCTAATNLRRM